MPVLRLPKLPQLLDRKIYKTGQTRGADDDVIYQNRVSRSSTVLIPYRCWDLCANPQDGGDGYESGFIVLLSPLEYFGKPNITEELAAKGLALGTNALVFYETREAWQAHNPDTLKWKPAKRRTNPLGGRYVARIPATTATENGGRIIRGFDVTSNKGAGIRVYEYASSATTAECRLQLEALFWLCADSETVACSNGMTPEDAASRRAAIFAQGKESRLLDTTRLVKARILNAGGKTICPLCLEELSGQGFFNRMAQAEGREVTDLTVTQLNLFHIAELRFGVLNHRPYNVGWGHHHCNVVVKDSGILETLEWMRQVLSRNLQAGHLPTVNKAS
ncbi:MAG: Restriction endonuclease type II BstXI [Limisphaerales bacterium]|nr:MAG: Restriction endonuclease type II BstXI [Limisphaerales bacterium]KAG0510167.1 MAG: Restriction endonuclease type II BstXI [Limisphaerales bacterium]TXT51950.1 MAG: Restriction endonuclease type II BstXI [Limisphaerales bacterium]